MAIRSPKHGLTFDGRGWLKKINKATKRICGKVDATEADRIYESRMSELWAAIQPEPAMHCNDDQLVEQLFAQWITIRRTGGSIKASTIRAYQDCLQSFLNELPRDTRFSAIKDDPFTFTKIHAKWQATYTVAQLFKRITVVRMAFRWLKENNFISELPKSGGFRQPKYSDLKKASNAWAQKSGGVSFSRLEIERMLAGASVQMKALILLGINGGYGNTDCSELPQSVADLDGGWIDYSRAKTGTNRRVPLWPETIAAIRDTIKISTRPGYIFGSLPNKRNGREGGMPLVRDGDDRISVSFSKLCKAANCHRNCISFYGLRRTFATFASMYGPTLFVKRITGHCSDDEDRIIDNHYIRGDVDKMLIKIAKGVRQDLICGTAMELKGVDLPAASARSARARRANNPQSMIADTSPSDRTDGPGSRPNRAAVAA